MSKEVEFLQRYIKDTEERIRLTRLALLRQRQLKALVEKLQEPGQAATPAKPAFKAPSLKATKTCRQCGKETPIDSVRCTKCQKQP